MIKPPDPSKADGAETPSALPEKPGSEKKDWEFPQKAVRHAARPIPSHSGEKTMNQTTILIGNLFSLLAMVSDSVSGTREKHKDIMAVQIVSQFFYGVSSVVLRGYSSTAQNAVAVFRNLAAMKNVKSRVLEWALILSGVVLGILFNNRGLLGFLPVLANLEYSVSVFRFKDDEKALKLAFILNMIMYAVFNGAIMNYVGVLSCSIVAVTTAASLLKAAKGTGR